MSIDLNLEHVAPAPTRKDYRIGAIGAGFIMSDCHLVAYGRAGYNVVGITSASARGVGTGSAGARNTQSLRHLSGIAR